MVRRAGNSKRTMDLVGKASAVRPSWRTHSTLVGWASCSAQLAPSRMWQAMSPRAPQPQSQKPRHLKGV